MELFEALSFTGTEMSSQVWSSCALARYEPREQHWLMLSNTVICAVAGASSRARLSRVAGSAITVSAVAALFRNVAEVWCRPCVWSEWSDAYC